VKNAISYCRFSSPKQAANDSYRRQIDATSKFCSENDLKLIDHYQDLGVSAWTSKNLSDDAALGGFLKLVELGKIQKGIVLIVENLDRLSRAKILDALYLFTSIIKNGIEIVTTMDGKWYSEKSISENPTELMVSIIYLTRGNNESETKSLRLKASWLNRHNKISKGEFAKVHCPSWITKQDGKYILIEEHAKTIRIIFELYLKGYGVYSLIQHLNDNKIKSFTKSCAWKPVFIHKLLQNHAVIGTYENLIPPILNYYPSVISEETFYKAIKQRNDNRNFRGKTGLAEVNIFAGLCRCFKCDSTMVKHSCMGKGKNAGTKYTTLVCSQARIGKCDYVMTSFDKINNSFLYILNNVNFIRTMFSSVPTNKDTSELIKGKIIELQKTIERISEAIVKTDSPALVVQLTKLEIERKQLEKDYQNALAEKMSQTDVRADYKLLMAKLNEGLKEEAFRLTLRNVMRKNLSKIIVSKDSYKVCFKNSEEYMNVFLYKEEFEVCFWEDSETYSYGVFSSPQT
jgi:DNA invertase Pin-like site-specific DNA recombinase